MRNEVLELDLNMVSYLAELGKLAFSPEELEQMAKDMTKYHCNHGHGKRN